MVVLIVLIAIGCVIFNNNEKNNYDYLRLHIRANSNSAIDQNVKYEVKDFLVGFLTPYLSNVNSKKDAENIINKLSYNLENECEKILNKKGFNYSVNIKISNEYFPTRTYSNTTLESGFYDAVIVELGEAKGDNWWCVMYPPLCFVNKNENSIQIKYKSKFYDWFKKIF